MLFKSKKKILNIILSGFFTIAMPVSAEEVPVGTVLNADNVDRLKEMTLQGKRVGDLLTDKFEMWVRDYGLTMKLGHNTKLEFDPAYLKATKKYSGMAVLNPKTKEVTNYKAGMPFDQIDIDDPDAGYKLAWNHYYANPVFGDTWAAIGEVSITKKDKGLVDQFAAASGKSLMEGRTNGSIRLGNKGRHANYLLVITNPYDIAGLGVYNQQYSSGKVDDGWVYVKSIRRTRRTAGGKSWMDPQPKMDLLNDDNQGVLGYPLWFKNWKLLERRWILAVVTDKDANLPHSFDETLDITKPPYWNTKNITWEPREVYVVEGITPEEHPYGRKVLYMDVDYPFYYHSEIYDKKGAFWRLWRQSYGKQKTGNGMPGVSISHTQAIDFQRGKATYIDIVANKINYLKPDYFSPSILKVAASGELEKELRKK